MTVLQPCLEYGCEVWNTAVRCGILINLAKALEAIQLHACKYILGCSVTTCDESVRADLGLKTLRKWRDFHKLKWYRKVMSINDESVSLTTHSGEVG